MKSGKLLLPLLLSLSLTGCAFNSVLVNYPSQLVGVRAELNSSMPGNAAKELAGGISSRDGLLYAQEAGRAAQISGDFTASKDYYQSAIAAYQAFDDKAKLSLSELGSQGGSLLLNDNIIPYRGPGYERIMLHQYQALNYLFAGDAEGALVEVRRSNELQSLEQQRYEKSSSAVQQMANGTISAEMDKLGKAAGSVTSSFLNAYSYYTTGYCTKSLVSATMPLSTIARRRRLCRIILICSRIWCAWPKSLPCLSMMSSNAVGEKRPRPPRGKARSSCCWSVALCPPRRA